jgi:VanZ family protein
VRAGVYASHHTCFPDFLTAYMWFSGNNRDKTPNLRSSTETPNDPYISIKITNYRDGKIQCMSIRSFVRSGVVRWAPAVLLMAVIFLLSSIPSEAMPVFGRYDWPVKKLGHVTGYALLSYSILRGLGRKDLPSIGLAWLLTVLFGASDELHQAFVPGRQSSLIDIGIDAIGAFFGVLPSLYHRSRYTH